MDLTESGVCVAVRLVAGEELELVWGRAASRTSEILPICSEVNAKIAISDFSACLLLEKGHTVTVHGGSDQLRQQARPFREWILLNTSQKHLNSSWKRC